MTTKWIEIISTNRVEDIAYVAITQENPYNSFNTSVYLSWIEELMGCKFIDGEHPFVKMDITNIDWKIYHES